MRDGKDRNVQIENIATMRKSLQEIGISIISIDTNKKELGCNFKKAGNALSNGTHKTFDHDFATFGIGTIFLMESTMLTRQ